MRETLSEREDAVKQTKKQTQVVTNIRRFNIYIHQIRIERMAFLSNRRDVKRKRKTKKWKEESTDPNKIKGLLSPFQTAL